MAQTVWVEILFWVRSMEDRLPRKLPAITLASLLPLSEEEVNERAREAFLSRIDEHPEDGYFEDAADTIRAKTDFLSQSYLTQEGVVFYAQPYEIGPYASGFIEVTVPWEDLGL